jgi:hypothetical protein
VAALEYSVLVISLASEVVTIVQHYRDRADCENNFDDIKSQWLGRFCVPENQTVQQFSL